MNPLAAIIAAWKRRKWARLTPQQQEMRRVRNEMSPEERIELERELADDSDREFLARSQAEHQARQKAIEDERLARATQAQAEHAAFIKSLIEESPRASRKRPKK